MLQLIFSFIMFIKSSVYI